MRVTVSRCIYKVNRRKYICAAGAAPKKAGARRALPELFFMPNKKQNLENTWVKAKVTGVKNYDLCGEIL